LLRHELDCWVASADEMGNDHLVRSPITGSDVRMNEKGVDTPAEDDARSAFVYQEALRGLQQQQSAIQSLQTRAATLIFAASFASSLLGSQALENGLGVWDWIALGLLFAIGALAVLLLWPYYNLTFRFDPEDLLARYVDVAAPMPMSAIHRELALQIKSDWKQNGRIVRRLREALQLALILLLFEIVAWLASIAAASGT
jgi:hypothetical protein